MEPTHLGALLRIYVPPALNLSVGQAARDQQITRQTLHRILAGAAARTPEMAGRTLAAAEVLPASRQRPEWTDKDKLFPTFAQP
jgi:plasmid maintenance system antidote protein VapI